MTKMTPAAAAGWILLLTAFTPRATPAEPPFAGKYSSADGSFEVSVLPGYSVHTGKGKPSQSYIPVCRDESLVCITFPRGRYEGTNFGDASIEISVLPAKTSQACLIPGKFELSTLPDAEIQIDAKNSSRMINGIRFLHAFDGGVALSHWIATDRYRGYKNGRCYELAIQVTCANFHVYEPGTIKEFTEQDEQEVTAQLRRILDSFRSLH